MKTEILNTIQQWLKPIQEQMESNRKAMLASSLTGSASGGIGGLGASLLQKLYSGDAAVDPAQLQQDLQTRGLLTRIKYANIPRSQRDSLSSTVRMLAAENRLGEKSMRKLYEMVALMESMGAGREKKTLAQTGTRERTVDQEMDWIFEQRAGKKARDARISSLQSSFAMYA